MERRHANATSSGNDQDIDGWVAKKNQHGSTCRPGCRTTDELGPQRTGSSHTPGADAGSRPGEQAEEAWPLRLRARARSCQCPTRALGRSAAFPLPEAPAPPLCPAIGESAAPGAEIRGVPPPPPMGMRQRRARWRKDHGVDTAESECGNRGCRVGEESPARAGLGGNAAGAGARCGREAAPRAAARLARLCLCKGSCVCIRTHVLGLCVCKRRACVCVDAKLCQRAWASDHMTAQRCVLPPCSEVARRAPHRLDRILGRGLHITVLVFVDGHEGAFLQSDAQK